MTATPAGWYDDGTGVSRWWDGTTWTEQVQDSATAGASATPPAAATGGFFAPEKSGSQPRASVTGGAYVVLQVVLKEKFWGTGSGNLTELEGVINAQAALGYRLHTITTASSGSKGIAGGDRIQATLVFERI